VRGKLLRGFESHPVRHTIWITYYYSITYAFESYSIPQSIPQSV
jgi:hypothetical protein